MSRTRRVVATTLVLIGVGIGRAQADPGAPPDWRGSWLLDGACAWRHVGARAGGLVLEGRVAGFDLELEGVGSSDGFTLRGTALALDDGAAWPAALSARVAGGDGRLEVALTIDDRPPLKETWVRPAAPSVRLVAPGGRRGPLSLDTGVGLRLQVHVGGRPQAVVVSVLAPDDPRYAHLGGVVHHAVLAEGRPLLVGRHEVTWDGRDRSPHERPLLPGRYLLRVTAASDLLGAPPGEDPSSDTVAEVTLVVGPDLAPAPAADEPTPTPPDAPQPGLTDRVARR